MPHSLFISAGEPSGDQHAARLIQALRAQDPACRFLGFGGPAMRSAGADLFEEMTALAVMGIVEAVPRIRHFWGLAQRARQWFRQGKSKTSAVVLVDYPGFNWHIARYARESNIPVLYYLPPQLWAWAPWRLKKIRRYVDEVLTVLPFEHDWYVQRGINATYVGHPFFDAVAESNLDQPLLKRLDSQAAQGERLIAILPGSRNHEVQHNGPLLVAAMSRLQQRYPDVSLRFLIAAYRDAHAVQMRDWIREQAPSVRHDIYVGRTSEVIQAAQCGMMVSGSVSLEMLARDTPAVVVYRVSRLMHAAARVLVDIPSFTLPNLISGHALFPETVSVGNSEPAVDFLVNQTERLLFDRPYAEGVRSEMAALRGSIAKPGASQAAAAVIAKHLPTRVRQAA